MWNFALLHFLGNETGVAIVPFGFCGLVGGGNRGKYFTGIEGFWLFSSSLMICR
jgi:hypothetical protein